MPIFLYLYYKTRWDKMLEDKVYHYSRRNWLKAPKFTGHKETSDILRIWSKKCIFLHPNLLYCSMFTYNSARFNSIFWTHCVTLRWLILTHLLTQGCHCLTQQCAMYNEVSYENVTSVVNSNTSEVVTSKKLNISKNICNIQFLVQNSVNIKNLIFVQEAQKQRWSY